MRFFLSLGDKALGPDLFVLLGPVTVKQDHTECECWGSAPDPGIYRFGTRTKKRPARKTGANLAGPGRLFFSSRVIRRRSGSIPTVAPILLLNL